MRFKQSTLILIGITVGNLVLLGFFAWWILIVVHGFKALDSSAKTTTTPTLLHTEQYEKIVK